MYFFYKMNNFRISVENDTDFTIKFSQTNLTNVILIIGLLIYCSMIKLIINSQLITKTIWEITEKKSNFYHL